MAIIRRYAVDLSAEQLDFLQELVDAHGWRIASDPVTYSPLQDDLYIALRDARPSLTIIRPD